MVLIPSAADAVENDVASAKEIIANQKALILVPSFSRGEEWAETSPAPSREMVPEAVESFREAPPPGKLTLAARYDGIDLPGDSCRMMVLDGLPAGSGPLETFQWDRLNMQNSLRSMLATRLVQSFGRISRGMSDHGVVILTGKSLVDWLLVPRNRSLLPKFLQKQIEIGEAVSRQAKDSEDLLSAAAACLSRDPGWIQSYTNAMTQLPSETESGDLDKALKVALAEARFGTAFWNRDFQRAASELNAVLEDAFDFSQFAGAWLSLWLGFALEMDGDSASAHFFYRKSNAAQSNMPRPIPASSTSAEPVQHQVTNVAEQMRIGHSNAISIEIPKSMTQDLSSLNGDGSARQVEEALRCLGQYLGLDATRPDNEFGMGPDVLWIGENGYAVCMEVKTSKEETSLYRKDNVGQLHNHVQWVKDNQQVSKIMPIFVGPLLSASDEASPSPDMRVVKLHEFEKLGQRLSSALRDAAVKAIPLSLSNDLGAVMRNRDLLFPDVLMSLNMKVLRDIPPK